MKINIKKTAITFMFIFSLYGCSSDSENPTPKVCPKGYTGTDCNVPITPTKIKVTKLKVTNFPNVNGTASWDFNSNPDIYLQLNNSVTDTYFSNVLSNGTNSFEFIPTVPFEIVNVNELNTIYLGDYDLNDVPSTSNDLMATIYFYPYQSANGFPTTLYLASSNNTDAFKVELTLAYEW